VNDHHHFAQRPCPLGHAYAPERHDHDESIARGLREDLSRAEERIRELEEKLEDDVRALWSHISEAARKGLW
jgi:hypothetical protein